jgi:predicted nucleic acid-binding protein
VVVVDTSVLIEVDAGNAAAAERVNELLEADAVSVSAVTVYEMLAGPTTSRPALRFWREFFSHVEVLPVLGVFAELGAAGARAANGMAAADGLIAATAAAYGRRVLTADAGFRRYPGIDVEWIAPRRRALQ